MMRKIAACLLFLFASSTAPAAEEAVLEPLPCGIYDEAVRPLEEKDLATTHIDREEYSMHTETPTGRKLKVEVKNVVIAMCGERNHVSVFLDDKPLAKTSHQDVPIYLEVHVDNAKYRIICVRIP